MGTIKSPYRARMLTELVRSTKKELTHTEARELMDNYLSECIEGIHEDMVDLYKDYISLKLEKLAREKAVESQNI